MLLLINIWDPLYQLLLNYGKFTLNDSYVINSTIILGPSIPRRFTQCNLILNDT